ncbi:unnamed protein product [Adineta ricciae]|uniref:Single-stranded DNA binding protein Ssb-like OB fold domain-containing protein n=1 Tax=Adineta ricciae TaxID=249248 RepID=A0A815S9P6_ADIRI|nr:unnamed protein product [Adineta ricciae]
MKRTTTCDVADTSASASLTCLNGYVIHINKIAKNSSNENHHYSFLVCLEDQSTVRVVKYLGKAPSCCLYQQLKESLKSGNGASITSLREQNGQFACTASTKILEKKLEFRPECIKTVSLSNLRGCHKAQMCTVEVKVCEIRDAVQVAIEQNEFKRIQKLKKSVVVGDSTGALELTLWENQFDQITLGTSYHIRLLKIRMFNDQISLNATSDTSFIKIDDLREVIEQIDNNLNSYKSDKGQIVFVEPLDNQYKCQGCGDTNFSENENTISCNDCRSRFLKQDTIQDDFIKIKIATYANEEYNLKVNKSLLSVLLNNSTLLGTTDTQSNNFEENLEIIIGFNVEFAYDYHIGYINALEIINQNQPKEENQLSA